MDEIYLLVYPDGTLMTMVYQPKRSHVQKGAQLFEVDADITIAQISSWIGHDYPESQGIKEIKNW